jgi:hypothetical protein
VKDKITINASRRSLCKSLIGDKVGRVNSKPVKISQKLLIDFEAVESKFLLVTRVTRLDDFSPIGRLITLGIYFCENYSKKAQIIGLRFSRGKSYALSFTKNGLGHILGYFFTNSSCPPACNLNTYCLFRGDP